MKIPKKLANRFGTTKQDRSNKARTEWNSFFGATITCSAHTCIFLRWKCPVSTSSPPCTLYIPVQCLSESVHLDPVKSRPRYAVLGTGPNGLAVGDNHLSLFIWSYLILFVHFAFGRVNTALILCVSVVLRLLNDRKSIQWLGYWSHYWVLCGP